MEVIILPDAKEIGAVAADAICALFDRKPDAVLRFKDEFTLWGKHPRPARKPFETDEPDSAFIFAAERSRPAGKCRW